MSIAFILAGFLLLMFGGDTLVTGAVNVAKRLNMPAIVIGIVLVGFGTSVPELLTSVQANMQGYPGIAVGNVIGSNIANILLVAGAGAILVPIVADKGDLQRDGLVLGLSSLMFLAAAYSGLISYGLGLLFVVALVVYVAYLGISTRRTAREEKKALQDAENATVEDPPKSLGMAIVYTLGGIALTVLGADLLVRGATDIATNYGISDTIIGLTIVAIGTSLPELATAIMAGIRGQSDISVGNIIGSNIYNILAILGITALIKPLVIDPSVLNFDIWVMLASSAALLILPFIIGTIGRKTGIVFLIAYAVYLYILYLQI